MTNRTEDRCRKNERRDRFPGTAIYRPPRLPEDCRAKIHISQFFISRRPSESREMTTAARFPVGPETRVPVDMYLCVCIRVAGPVLNRPKPEKNGVFGR